MPIPARDVPTGKICPYRHGMPLPARYAHTGKGCPCHGIKATGKTKKQKYIILFVLNKELTWKRLCRCFIYVLNIIPKRNKSTELAIFH
jgi:hypothetical protein